MFFKFDAGLSIGRLPLAALLSMLIASSNAQLVHHTITASYISQPNGPNSDFSINLTLSPSDVDIVGFEISVGYNNFQGNLISIFDNTGQPLASVEYITGGEQSLPGVGYANVYRPVIMSTLSDLIEPINLAQLNFRTSASYAHSQNQFYVYLSGRDRVLGPGDDFGGLVANLDGTWEEIPTTYNSLVPLSSIPDWSIY